MTAQETTADWAGGDLPAPDSPYWMFYDRVAAHQLGNWLPEQPSRVLDLSARRGHFARQMVVRGHEVVHIAAHPEALPPPGAESDQPDACRHGRVLQVIADPRRLLMLADGGVDAVLAESRALSLCLAAETTLEDVARVLRPGGRLLLVVDSLMLGLARLADQGRWAELADVPSADVVLVPADDGTISRCFWPDELREALTTAGLEVDWVRPRSVLSQAAVERALRADPSALDTLVTTEVQLATEREDDSVGIHLVAAARRRD